MFAALENQLHAVLVDSTEPSSQPIPDYYVCKRLSSYPPASRSALIDRMPEDIRALIVSDSEFEQHVDTSELDLIDFLLHYQNNRVLSIVGPVGIGKTTFIHHILNDLKKVCPSLQRFVPIIMNCLGIGTGRPTYQDFIYEISSATTKSLIDQPNIGLTDFKPLQALLSNFALEHTRGASSAHFVDFVAGLKSACGEQIEPIIIFDNVDHLSPESVLIVEELGRAVHLNTGLCVLTTLRPATHYLQEDRSHGKGAFCRFLIELAPPDLRAVLRVRLRHALSEFTSLKTRTPRGLSVEISDVEQSLNSLSERVLSPYNQEIFLRDICNNNVRKALYSFGYFLRYRELHYQLLFSIKANDAASLAERQGSWFDHLLDGLMIGDYEHFIDGKGPIANILVFEQPGSVDYVVLYACLSLLNWAGRFVEQRELIGWLAWFGYDRVLALQALGSLLARSLIYSPETEDKIEAARNLRLSNSGKYYIDHLVQHPQYLYNAVYDVPLPHASWKEDGRDTFAVRMNSIWELLTTVFEAETAQLTFVCKQRAQQELLGSVRHSGMLTRRLLHAAIELINRTYFAKFEGARAASAMYGPKLRALSDNVASGENKIGEELLRFNLIPKQSVSTKTVGDKSDVVRLTVPNEIGPGLKNLVGVELDLEGVADIDPIVLYWQAMADGKRYEEIAELKYSTKHSVYRGAFVISDVASTTEFPDSKITVFSASNPIMVTHIDKPVGA